MDSNVSVAWSCSRCQWTGYPSFGDSSDLRPAADGTLVMDRAHVAICPCCFDQVVAVSEAQARVVAPGAARPGEDGAVNDMQAFWSLAILVTFLLPLIVGAALIERPSRRWLKRLRGIENRRRAMSRDAQ